jgi:hypothetical protein
VFRSSTQFSLVGFRTQLFSSDDIDNVKKVQSGYKAQTLSTYLKQPPPPAPPAIDFPKINKDLVKTNFFEYLGFGLQFAPAEPNEKEMRAQLARIGIGPGKIFNFKNLSREQKLAVVEAMKEGERKVEEAVASAGKSINGWRVARVARRQRPLQWQLVEPRGRCAGRHIRQQSGGGDVSLYAHGRRRSNTRREQAQLHAHLRHESTTACQWLLVADDVRWQDAAPDQESD